MTRAALGLIPWLGTWVGLALTVVFVPTCGPKVVLVERPGCEACHNPLSPDGTAHGIEEAHPEVAGVRFECVDCHGGDPDSRKQSEAHVGAGAAGSPFIKGLTIGELDALPAEYIRFVNPGDLRVASQSCGAGSGRADGTGCHEGVIDRVKRNQMATFSGELGVARYRAGAQNTGAGLKAVYEVRDPDFVRGAVPGTVSSLGKMEEPRVAAGEPTIGPYQDLYLTKACMRCHLWSFGDNKFPGDFRSSGCSACHMIYDDDGLSGSADPTVPKDAPPHARTHELTKAIPSQQCMHCHYRGGRIGPAYHGYREGAGPGFDPPEAGYLGEARHGHDASFYVVDEDTTNDRDETPPDVHQEAGMHCIDCHTEHDVHGDGRIYVDTTASIEIRCESCHGTIEQPSDLKTALGNPLDHLERDGDGVVWLTTKVDGKRLRVPQIADAVKNAPAGSTLHASMGRDPGGFSHVDKLECYTCHSGWVPTCYGCHVTVDMQGTQRSLISGQSTTGLISGTRKWVATDDLILIENTRGRIAPSMPAERMFFNAIDGDGNTVIDKAVRTGPGGEIGNGHRAFQPHTVRRWSPFMRCTRCHPVETTFENMDQVNVAIGLGSDRYLETDGAGQTWQLDRVIDDTYASEVLIGHDEPIVSRPLQPATINKMLAAEVPLPSCSVPTDVLQKFPVLQSEIFTPRCATSGCHVGRFAAADLDLSPEKMPGAVVNVASTGKAGATLVAPGDPDGSYLLQKLESAAGIVGDPMPGSGDALLACELEAMRAWITAGANP